MFVLAGRLFHVDKIAVYNVRLAMGGYVALDV